MELGGAGLCPGWRGGVVVIVLLVLSLSHSGSDVSEGAAWEERAERTSVEITR